MTTEELSNKVEAQIIHNKELSELVLIVQQFKDNGGKQKDAEECLLKLYSKLEQKGIDEHEMDKLRDLIDYVVGHVAPINRIWPTIK